MATTTETRYLTATETTRLMRAALKVAFPATKFSVRKSTSGSVRILWTDGPTSKAVDAITDGFAGEGFDGMIDMRYQIRAWMLNGEILGTRSQGTGGSRGSVPAWGLIAPHDDAELVAFGVDFVFTERTISPALATKAAAQVATYYGLTAPVITATESGRYEVANDTKQVHAHWYWADLIRQAAEDRTRFAPTMAGV